VSLPTGASDWTNSLHPLHLGEARIERTDAGLRLIRLPSTAAIYSDAELLGREPNRWRPPLSLIVRARFSHPVEWLRGTAGFGFWNAGIGPTVRRPRPPRAVWFFFGGPPFDVPLALGVPGYGFKAAVLDAQRLLFFALLPFAPLGFLLMRQPTLYRWFWPIVQTAIGVAEVDLSELDLTATHSYRLDWRDGTATFGVDGQEVMTAPAPAGPLELVIWIDNSYAIATPQGRFSLGLVAASETQWLEIENVEVRVEG